MNSTILFSMIVSLIGCFLSPSLAFAEPLSVGHSLTPFTLADQFAKSQQIAETDTLLLFAADMEGAGLVKQAFVESPSDPFAPVGIRYVADISEMPALVATMFAKPKMRDYPYSVILDEEGETTLNWPRQAGLVTVMRLQQLRLAEVSYCASSECLSNLLSVAKAQHQTSVNR
jgi:hypothetical protein